MIRLKTFFAVAFASAVMLIVMATPAFAFHHVFLPGEPAGKARTRVATTPRPRAR